MLVKCDKDLYQAVQAGPWFGLAKVQVTEAQEPRHRWAGLKRPLELAQQVSSFFEWGYDLTKGETMAHWFYHPEQGWQVLILPQRGYTGMTVKVIEDHAQYVPTFQRLGEGWEMMGTDHHHCSGGAFQSSVDQNDEVGKEGLHLTYGNIGSNQYSLHARASFRRTLLACNLSDWYELPAAFQSLPVPLKDQIVEHQLRTPDKAVAFPEWWKENVIRETRVTTYGGNQQHWQQGRQVAGFNYLQGVDYGCGYQTPQTTSQYGGRKTLREDMQELSVCYNLPLEELSDLLKKLQEEPELEAIIDALSWGNWHLKDAEDVVEQLRKEAQNKEIEAWLETESVIIRD